jgi:hypothetical protein
MKKPQPKRSLRIIFNDGSAPKDIEIGKYTQIMKKLQHVLFHIDKLDDGKLLMIVGCDFVEDFNTVDRIEVVREN